MRRRFAFVFATTAIVAASLSLSAREARASLIGDTVSNAWVETGFPTASLGTAVIGSGTEFLFNTSLQFDFAASTLTITSVPGAISGFFVIPGFNGFVFSDLTHPFTSVSIDPLTNVAGFTASNLTFSGEQIDVDLNGLLINGAGLQRFPFTEIVLDIDTASAVPEPGTLTLFGSGLAGLVGLLRRRKSAAAI